MIEHLVLSGGSYFGLYQLGVLKYLSEVEYYSIHQIRTIYATSVGSLIGTILSLKIPMKDIEQYLIHKPWHKYICLESDKLINSYYKKGLMDRSFFISILEPLLNTVDLDTTITLKEFYNYSKIKICIMVYNVNKNQCVSLDYLSHPELPLLDAIYMSCSIPVVFQPLVYNGDYYLDGGIEDNYPVYKCFKGEGAKVETILGIHVHNPEEDTSSKDNIMNFGIYVIHQLIEKIQTKKQVKGVNEIIIPSNGFSVDDLIDTIQEKNTREKSLDTGYKYGQVYYLSNQAKNE